MLPLERAAPPGAAYFSQPLRRKYTSGIAADTIISTIA